MNNNLYHWHDEQMVKHEMQEVDRAVTQARLLKEAGLVGPSLLARMVSALRGLFNLRRPRESTKEHRPFERVSYRSIEKTDCKS